MCGICGFTGPDPDHILDKMNATIVHRGPDEDGFLRGGQVNLAMRRLSILDFSGGAQPVFNEDRSIALVFNGEIYNHRQLRQDLIQKGHTFRSDHSDTETVVHLYEEYGEKRPQASQANGMFAAALWDSRSRRLLLYRDRIGKKPLYWCLKDGFLAFGSEIKALLAHPKASRDLDHKALYHYFSLKT